MATAKGRRACIGIVGQGSNYPHGQRKQSRDAVAFGLLYES